MSVDLQKQLTTWATRGVGAFAVGAALFIFNDMRESVANIEEKVNTVSEVVIRLDEKVERNRSDIERIDREKVNK